MNKDIKTHCLSLDCPERFSLCCGAGSKEVITDCFSSSEGTGYFACSNCGKEFVGGKCTAAERNNYMQVGRTIECGNCHPEKYEHCSKVPFPNGCKCVCHDKLSNKKCCKECKEWKPNDKRLSRASCKHCPCHQEQNDSWEERLDKCIAKIKESKGDCLWCGLCFKVFSENDLRNNPDNFYRCAKCGIVRDIHCVGPTFEPSIRNLLQAERERALEEVEEMVKEMKKNAEIYPMMASSGVEAEKYNEGYENALSILLAKLQSMK